MNQFKIGDRVRALKDCHGGWFTIGQIGTVEGANEHHIFVTFDNGREAPVKADEIELIGGDTMKPFKIGDRVRAVKKSKHFAPFEKGWEGVIEDITDKYPNFFVLFENDDDSWWLEADEIELIEAEPTTQKPFPTFEEFDTWYCETEPVKSNGECKWTQQVYDYLAQFGVREVFPEVGKEYEADQLNSDNIIRGELNYFHIGGYACHKIRPIQPSRLEQLMEKHPNLTDTEQKELLDLLLTQTK